MDVMQELERWHQHGWLRALDLNFGRYLQQKAPADAPLVWLLGALTSHQLGRGHPCLDIQLLAQDADSYLLLPPEQATSASRSECVSPTRLLQAAGLSDAPAQLQSALAGAAGGANSPLVFAADRRLYLRRFWRYEKAIKQDLEQRMNWQPDLNLKELSGVLDQLFGPPGEAISWQRVACAMAVRSGFSIITGGPGTGKTYTVVRLLATLQRMQQQAGALTIQLAAPTGKAAARMTESIRNELATMPDIDDIRELLSPPAVTLHRLLGTRRQGRGFRHNARNPLVTDVVIVDEASMVDIEMMAALVAALPSHARLILLGDKDQLASVGAGAVLGQLCSGAEQGHYQPDVAQWLEQASRQRLPEAMIDGNAPVSGGSRYNQHTVMLRSSRRFDDTKGIGKLAAEVNNQRTDWLRNWLADSEGLADADPRFANIVLLQVQAPGATAMKQLVQQGLQPFLQSLSKRPEQAATDADFDIWAGEVLEHYGAFQILTAVNEGDWGMRALNERVMNWLDKDTAGAEPWYAGRPVMITHNDYNLNLRNGDIGIALQRRPGEPLRVAFKTADNRIRWLLPSRLTQVETVYAMTVHKSQGSEFVHTVVVLPDRESPVLTKELLYTGITRARERFTLVAGSPRVVLDTVSKRVERLGGLV
ncbi:exodeoxyribonuclease V subunit alpha [Pseudidiomarina salinarum]|uniref:exodeoxyribonuclease V subunit alpha n=1 Tax=Pseudidiomarina salinarum TaxID=435908 RepID=UPI00055915CC|nr:exodeoxyribonuclease V subunit alpha [Pseudidiomarina salinarum]RUO69082.1 exodeoxyribonuclease V subunit alpha [Pseudidiomarina salinarum]